MLTLTRLTNPRGLRCALRHTASILLALFCAMALITPADSRAAPASEPLASDVEVTGPIEAMVESIVTVRGIAFVVSTQTEIRDADDNPASLSLLSVGLVVEAEGDYNASGVLIATEITIEDEDDDYAEVETEGPIMALTDSSLTVGGLIFGVTAATRVEGSGALTFSDLMLGDYVEVEGQYLGSGAPFAYEIELRDGRGDGDDDYDVELRGSIQALVPDSVTVAGWTFLVTPQTVVLGRNNQILSPSALVLGQLVEIEGRFNASGALVAHVIEIEDIGTGEIELTSSIESLRPTGLTVTGIDFDVNAQTIVLDHARHPISFTDLAVGMLVEIRGFAGTNGQYVATRIKLEDSPDNEIELRATLDIVRDSMVVVLGKAFLVGATTRILSNSDLPLPLSALAAGQIVEIDAWRAVDGSLRALTIEQEDGPAGIVRLRAQVTAVGADSLDVLDVRFATSGATVVRADGSSGTFADVTAGQAVHVDAIREGTGLRATRIRILRSTQAAGVVGSSGATALTIAGLQVSYSDATLFTNGMGAVLTSANVTVGSTVHVSGTSTQLGQIDARRVVIVANAGTVSSTNTPEDVGVAIERAFPNPTSGVASIRFTLAEAATATIEIMDVLGRVIASSVLDGLGAGSNVAVLPTATLAPGRYLVRLRVNGKPTVARTITVIR